MKVCVVSPFFVDDKSISRPAFVRDTLLNHSNDVVVLTSDFSHQLKRRVHFDSDKIITVRTLNYSNNKSVFRFASHFFLAIFLFLKAVKISRGIDVFYVTAPFAFTALLIKIFIRKKVIVDIIDYWPYSLPFKKNYLTSPFLKVWHFFNFLCFKMSDFTISLSSTFLSLAKVDLKYQILFGTNSKFVLHHDVSDKKISILYLGNIGELYDFESLISLFEKYPEKYVFEIVGSGDRLDWLKLELERIGVEHRFHGVVYCENSLKKIASKCHFGFNGYLKTNASFSYKALSYFSYGLPIINSMRGDIFNYVEMYNLGINYQQDSNLSLEKAILNYDYSSCLTQNVRRFFIENLEQSKIEMKIIKVFEELYD
ncbi:hypothetical protein KDN34_05460 [Shewanella yunxiaonensis]|uniref:Glycosyl transferase family 1 domain-containing protein n=1 Tax=Shewanella yunxiaonensis TaxID=2829809 RepID=A0ABX7YW71_9GAMM|nr:hypothetical protein [Shewanella yunxiaonensis]QUN06895.1 hypothetical protein KDN34_05460 [Shewanella yunxiaonensis]